MCFYPISRKDRQRRRGGSLLFFVIGLAILLVIVGGIAWYFVSGSEPDERHKPLLAEVDRGPYEHIVLEQGEVESSNNVEVRCEVRSRENSSGPSTSIIDVVPEGTRVEEGDWLVTFDSSALEQERSRQKIAVNTSEALMIEAKAAYETAKIAKEEYLSGTYNEEKKELENEIFVAEDELKKAELSYDSVKRLVSAGLLTELQLEGEKFRVDAAQNDLELAEENREVLEEFTKRKMLTELDSEIAAAEVSYRNERDSYQEELEKLEEIEEQIASCEVYAPQAGQVAYANVQSRRSDNEFVVEPGAAVRERQVIIRLPDPTSMQVKAEIEESRINLVDEGMQAEIDIDAFGGQTVTGEVTKVNKYAEPGSWWSSSAKEYATVIKIHDPPPGTRVGLTAEVQIHVEDRSDALQVPVQAVYERAGKTFCLVPNGDQYDTREVMISSTNEKVVALDEEQSEPLSESDKVVMNPRKHLDLFDQSRFPKESDSTPAESQGEELAAAKSTETTAAEATE